MTATPHVGRVTEISEVQRQHMRGRSWKPAARCPAFDELAAIRVPYWDFSGAVLSGEMIVASAVATELVTVFDAIFAAKFAIARMVPIDHYNADDDASMAANNSSCFCFRTAPSGRLSEHAFGLAVDINPVQNPMVIGERVWPESGRAYVDRSPERPGMIVRPGPVVDAFDAAGWEWGGDWISLKDYHHFQKLPRGARDA